MSSAMRKAIVLINTAPGGEDEVFKALKSEPGITEVHQLYGLYDLLAVVEAADDAGVKAVISNKVRSNPKVASTLTMNVVNSD